MVRLIASVIKKILEQSKYTECQCQGYGGGPFNSGWGGPKAVPKTE